MPHQQERANTLESYDAKETDKQRQRRDIPDRESVTIRHAVKLGNRGRPAVLQWNFNVLPRI